ncbi:MAG: outer membrane beta-barrel protein [Alphaproteobacteria bacterium]|uniref:outer membrane beta-barrel protein n=1 Tax=Hyphomonas sp. TaxID=87 RepID=UPI001D8D41DF|nr:outer membrane beta-barrel protein [Alphaproteobacteria bacterium]MBU2083329.1 outer membrane beta-barrel protein [Alphaproteobacteria bacterium]MBU2143706.1 outer membrane beta-barrel protein [Alphaproteobacteria bacterium]MBU2195613.1 outer membrane beta-barrel protein [Alphaproteobacteria bacterium]
MSNFKRFCLLSVATGSVLATYASAQGQNYYSREKYDAVLDRRQPAYDPEPIRLGAFLVDSSASGSATYTDNVQATQNNKISDTIVRIGAEVAARTNWNVHEIGAEVSAYRSEYLDNGDESANDLRARLRGRLDVNRNISIGGAVFAQDIIEARTELANAISLDSPVEYTRTGGSVDVNYQSDRFRWYNSVQVAEENFKDGVQAGTGLVIDQDYRDNMVTSARTRLSYAISPNVAVYTQGSVREQTYDQQQLLGGALRSRDSSGYTVAVGVDFELNTLVRGDVNVGYLSENKDDPFFKDVDGVSVDGRVQWFPTRLTTVSFNAGRRVVDIGVFESPSALQTTYGARVDHELRRNIILSASADFSNYDYQEINRSDDIADYSLTAAYKMNRRVHLETFVRHLNRDTSGSSVFGNPSFDVNLVGVGIKLFP